MPPQQPTPGGDGPPRPTDDPDGETGAPAYAREMFPSLALLRTLDLYTQNSKHSRHRNSDLRFHLFIFMVIFFS